MHARRGKSPTIVEVGTHRRAFSTEATRQSKRELLKLFHHVTMLAAHKNGPSPQPPTSTEAGDHAENPPPLEQSSLLAATVEPPNVTVTEVSGVSGALLKIRRSDPRSYRSGSYRDYSGVPIPSRLLAALPAPRCGTRAPRVFPLPRAACSSLYDNLSSNKGRNRQYRWLCTQ